MGAELSSPLIMPSGGQTKHLGCNIGNFSSAFFKDQDSFMLMSDTYMSFFSLNNYEWDKGKT